MEKYPKGTQGKRLPLTNKGKHLVISQSVMCWELGRQFVLQNNLAKN